MTDEYPRVFAQYRVEKALGPGGAYGITFLVRDEKNDPYALKWLKPDAPREGRFRFENEAWALQKVSHPSLPKFVGKGEQSGRPYIVMTFFPGQTLRSLVEGNQKEAGVVSQLKTLVIAEKLLEAVSCLHENGIVHRDIKDDNVIVSISGGELGLIDLGVCKGDGAPAEGQTFWNAGASRFSPPSKLEHPTQADPKHDVFAVGVLCYLLLSNEYPWQVPLSADAGHLRELMESQAPRPLKELNRLLDRAVVSLVEQFIETDDHHRPNASEALELVRNLRNQLENKVPSVISEGGLLKLPRVLRDPLHGDIPMTDFEHEIITTVEFQKLRRIHQLGFSYFVYPGAEHSRFTHAVGTMHVADKIMSRIELRTGVPFDSDERLMLRSFALIHDIAHIPYGHTLEDELNFFGRHDENDSRLQRMLGRSGSEIAAVLERTEYGRAVLDALASERPNSSNTWISEVVSSPNGADVLDYVDRDSLFCGLDHRVDSAIFRQFSIEKTSRSPGAQRHLVSKLYGRHGFRLDADHALLSLLRERFALFLKVYTHSAKIAAGAMLGKALYESDLTEPKVERMGDEELLWSLKSSRVAVSAKLAGWLFERRLYKPAFRARALGADARTSDQYRARQESLEALGMCSPEGRHNIEKEMAKEASVSAADVIVYTTKRAPGLQKIQQYVETGKDRRRVRDDVHHHHQEIYRDHLSLWNVYVFVNPEMDETSKIAVAAQAEARFPMKNEIQFNRRQLVFDLW